MKDQVFYILACAIVAAFCAVCVAAVGSPTWAWLSTGLVVYFSQQPQRGGRW